MRLMSWDMPPGKTARASSCMAREAAKRALNSARIVAVCILLTGEVTVEYAEGVVEKVARVTLHARGAQQGKAHCLTRIPEHAGLIGSRPVDPHGDDHGQIIQILVRQCPGLYGITHALRHAGLARAPADLGVKAALDLRLIHKESRRSHRHIGLQ